MCRIFSRTILSWVITAGLCAAALPSFAQDPYTLKIDVPFVSVDVSVSDAKGNLVRDLTQGDFTVLEDGTPQEIRFFSPVAAPYNVFLLFDRSGSTRSKWSFMRNAASRFIQNLRPQDRIAVGSFDERFDVHLNWSADRARAITSLEEIVRARQGNETRFYAALDRTLKRQFKGVAGRRAVVVLTDGQDTSFLLESEGDLKKALKAAREQRIPVYIVGVENEGAAYAVLPMTRRYFASSRRYMEELAESSGGQLLFPKTLNDVMPLYEQIGRELGTSYSLGYISSNPASAGAFRRIEVNTRNGSLRLTQTRTGYIAR